MLLAGLAAFPGLITRVTVQGGPTVAVRWEASARRISGGRSYLIVLEVTLDRVPSVPLVV